MTDNAVILGPYSQGEIPEPVVYTFKKSDGTPDTLPPGPPAFTAKFEYRRWNTTTPVELSATVLDQTIPANAGQVTWAWTGTDMAVYGDFEGELWVGNGTNRYRAVRFRWVVTPSVQVATV